MNIKEKELEKYFYKKQLSTLSKKLNLIQCFFGYW
jgi:hypothetical protein